MKKPIEYNKIYTVIEAADILGVNPVLIKKMIREKKLKGKRIGHAYKILGQSIIDVFIAVS